MRSCQSRNVALLHLHANMCTAVIAADSWAPSYLRCKGARDNNADTLCSSVVIKRKRLSMIPRDLNGNKVKKMLSSVEFKTRQHRPQSAWHLNITLFAPQNWISWACKSLVYPFIPIEDCESSSLYLIFSRALWTWMHFPSTKNFKSEISGLSNSFFKDCATVR